MNKIEIPTSFQLFGTDWKVIWDNDKCNDLEVYGRTDYSTSTITLSTTHGLENLSEDRIKSTFMHELTHAILDTLKEYELSKDEKIVDGIGNLMYQFLKTAKYE